MHHCVHLQLVSLAALVHTASLTLVTDLLCSASTQEEIVLLQDSMLTARNSKLPVNPELAPVLAAYLGPHHYVYIC